MLLEHSLDALAGPLHRLDKAFQPFFLFRQNTVWTMVCWTWTESVAVGSIELASSSLNGSVAAGAPSSGTTETQVANEQETDEDIGGTAIIDMSGEAEDIERELALTSVTTEPDTTCFSVALVHKLQNGGRASTSSPDPSIESHGWCCGENLTMGTLAT